MLLTTIYEATSSFPPLYMHLPRWILPVYHLHHHDFSPKLRAYVEPSACLYLYEFGIKSLIFSRELTLSHIGQTQLHDDKKNARAQSRRGISQLQTAPTGISLPPQRSTCVILNPIFITMSITGESSPKGPKGCSRRGIYRKWIGVCT